MIALLRAAVYLNFILVHIFCNKFILNEVEVASAGNVEQGCGSGSGLDPYSIGSVDPDPDPGGQK